MGRRYLIVGGVAGGASVAARLRRLDEGADITMLERGRDVSFSNCALPYFLGGEIAGSEDLKLVSPQTFWDRYRIRALTRHEALRIDRAAKTVRVRDLTAGTETDMPYDTLFLSPGASPIMPPSLPGINLPHVFSVRNVEDVERIDAWLKANAVRQVAVVGGGFIGLEFMENLHKAGYGVTVVDMARQVMLPLDEDMAQFLHREIVNHGVGLILGDGIRAITPDGVTLASGTSVPAGAVVMAIGVRPETGLARDAGLDIGETGAILVDAQMRTSDPDIFAVGDAVQVRRLQTGKASRLALAGPALRQARLAANAANGRADAVPGVIGSAVIRVFGLGAAATGMNEKQCADEGIDCGVSFVAPSDRVGIMPGAAPMFFKLTWEKGTGKVLGAQAVGRGSVDKRVDVVSAALRFGATIDDLKDLELCYAPTFGTARDVVNIAGLNACDQRDGLVAQVPFAKVRELVGDGAFLLDVREEAEYAWGHVKGAANVPLGALRDRLAEVPRDRPVYVYCRTGQRSYNAVRLLLQNGFRRVFNIAGSFLALSWHEYYWDRASGRDPVLTGYNFE
ncbi:MAG TPA: FAD-dependent oxidoreductase [Candidatus Limnocylindria bacterium]|nr:FAD-dependent oxidoreductase [Candidatus Limnocylindria bacterium]